MWLLGRLANPCSCKLFTRTLGLNVHKPFTTSTNVERKRLLMRINRTGIKELDIVLTNFLKQMDNLDAEHINDFHRLLDLDTQTIYDVVILGRKLPRDFQENRITAKLAKFVQRH